MAAFDKFVDHLRKTRGRTAPQQSGSDPANTKRVYQYEPWSDGIQALMEGWVKSGEPSSGVYYNSLSAAIVDAVASLDSILDGWAGSPDPILPILIEYTVPVEWVKSTTTDEPAHRVHFLDDTPSRVFAPTSIARYTDPWSWQKISKHLTAYQVTTHNFTTNEMTVVAMNCLTRKVIGKPYVFKITTPIIPFLHTFYPHRATGR